ncbi:WSC domain-containing protein [Lachnellula subtilissima]|uniref:WSC domain-containing protein n=1 Tax=Lachnellula subtilissima TaxID=602034 RepID=A0A8H8RY40_9HELO|nr:WSC domain-containing protein [Lachnellula subtilissima]
MAIGPPCTLAIIRALSLNNGMVAAGSCSIVDLYTEQQFPSLIHLSDSRLHSGHAKSTTIMLSFKSFTVASAALTLFSGVNVNAGLVQRNQQQPAPSCTSFTPFVYSGCFQDPSSPRALLYDSGLNTQNMTVEICVAFCKGNDYQYAGLEYYGECFCGASVNGPQIAESNCNYPCTGDNSEACGGNDIVSIYQDSTFPNVNKTIITDYQPLGCYTEGSTGRSLAWPQSQISASTMTVETCLAACKQGGYDIAGVEYGQECYCGVVLGNGTAPTSGCNMPCAGNSAETCGGSSMLNLFVASDLESSQICGAVPPSASSISASSSSSSSTSMSNSVSGPSSVPSSSSRPSSPVSNSGTSSVLSSSSSMPSSLSSTGVSSNPSTSTCTQPRQRQLSAHQQSLSHQHQLASTSAVNGAQILFQPGKINHLALRHRPNVQRKLPLAIYTLATQTTRNVTNSQTGVNRSPLTVRTLAKALVALRVDVLPGTRQFHRLAPRVLLLQHQYILAPLRAPNNSLQ